MTTVTYLLVRHGEAEGNAERRLIGQTDVPLSDLGRRQSEALAGRLAELPVTGYISSDLRRARETVEIAAGRVGMEVRTDPRLREIHNGEWTGLLPDEVAARDPDLWSRYRAGEDVPRPGGEQWIDVQARVVATLEDDTAERADGDVVVVGTHGGPVMALILWATGIELKGNIFTSAFVPASNASITAIELPRPRILSVNDTGHLGQLVTNAHMSIFQRR